MRLTRRKLGIGASVAAALTGCSLLTHLDEPTGGSAFDGGYEDATLQGEDASNADAALAPEDGGHGDATDATMATADDGPSADPCSALEAGAFCAYAGGCQCSYCRSGTCSATKACPEAFNWEAGNDLARRCSGLAVLTTTNENCGVCGVHCATAGVTSAQSCALLSGHYQCIDCAANSECWSGCCAIDTTPYHCAESDCNTGACVAGLCPAPSACVAVAGQPNYCAYE